MASEKNITMRQYNGVDYDTLYPKTKVEQVEGAYTQQQILADSTKGLYGLGADAVPDDVMAFLGKFNLYHWKRRKITKRLLITPVTSSTPLCTISYGGYAYFHYTDITPYITTDLSDKAVHWGATPVYYRDIYVSGSSGTAGTTSMIQKLRGKYWTYSGNTRTPNSPLVFSDENATFSTVYNSNVSTVVYGEGSSLISCEIVYGDWEELRSIDRNAYQDEGMSDPVQISDGYEVYEYQYIGKPFDALEAVPTKIETGSYVGTGAYGEDNKNEILLTFIPKFFVITPTGGSQNDHYFAIGIPGALCLEFNAYTGSSDYYTSIATFEAIENSLQWYYSNASSQLNLSGVTYKYVILG